MWYIGIYVTLSVFLLAAGCTPPEVPLPPVQPPPEDLSSWTVPALVQPDAHSVAPVPPTTKLPAGPAELVFDYRPGQAVPVTVAVGTPFDIVLEAGEQVRQIVDGDRAPAEQGQERRWGVKEGQDGSGEDLRPHIFVTVTEPDLVNGLIITTTRRTYLISCLSVLKSRIRVLRFRYPPEERPRLAEPPAPGLLPDPTRTKLYHVGYTVESHGAPPDWSPRGVWDDGQKTYLLYPEVTLFGTVPLVRRLGPNGPSLINARQFLNVVILDELVPRLELRVGSGAQAEVVTITRGALRTIACPQDPACPVWPEAAPHVRRAP